MTDNREEMSGKHIGAGFTVSFIVGAAIGVAMGLLYAPRPGRETREHLGERVRWITMSPHEKYAYLWERGGSIGEWLKKQRETRETT